MLTYFSPPDVGERGDADARGLKLRTANDKMSSLQSLSFEQSSVKI